MCAVSLLESREQRYIKAMNNNLNNSQTVKKHENLDGELSHLSDFG